MSRREQNVAEGQLARIMFITNIIMHDERPSGKSSLAALYSTPLHAILLRWACMSIKLQRVFVMGIGSVMRGSIYNRETCNCTTYPVQYNMHLHIW